MPADPAGGRQPLLTLAIPTFNRAGDLERLLTSLAPQGHALQDVDLYISDNASPDDTPALIARFQAAGLPIRYHRHAENIGSDANFVSCFHAAQGRYFWLCGDDEAIVPGGLDLILQHLRPSPAGDELDILFISSYNFLNDYLLERQEDKLRRQHHTFVSERQFTAIININFTFISGVVVHRERLLQLPHEDPAMYLGTNLVQLSWSLPLLRAHRRSRILWTRVIASRWANGGGYSLGNVFGRNLAAVTARLLPDRPDLSTCIMNFAIRRWFPITIIGLRAAHETTMQLGETDRLLRPIFGRNFRYWLFTYPALKLPLPLATAWVKVAGRLCSIVDHARNPGFWRKAT
jgi:abequosyltransferase